MLKASFLQKFYNIAAGKSLPQTWGRLEREFPL